MTETRLPAATFNRPPRLSPPALPEEAVDLPAPPQPPPLPEQSILITILPVLGIGVMAVFYVLRAAGDTGSSAAFFAVPMMLLAVFTIGGTILAQRWRRREYQKRRAENDLNYLRLLDRKRVRLQAVQDVQLALLETAYPAPAALLKRAFTPDDRLWERRPADDDFLHFRVGVGRVPSGVAVHTPGVELDSPLLDRALSLADSYRFLPDAPVVIGLQPEASCGVCGPRSATLALLRAILCQLALTHAPGELQIHLIAPESARPDWRWLKWLPHTHSPRGTTIAFTMDSIRNLFGMLGQVIDERRADRSAPRLPQILVVMDDPRMAETETVYTTLLREGHLVGAAVLCLTTHFEDIPGDCRAVLRLAADGFSYHRRDEAHLLRQGSRVDGLALAEAEAIARALASVSLTEAGSAGRIPTRVNFLELYGVRHADALEPVLVERWQRPVPEGLLPHPVPIGRESLAVDTLLLLDEANHGPHGVLAGTTGSGKSELMQSLVCALALEHDPRLLTLLLIDFKGGSTFQVFEDLPHTVGMVTNLDGVRVRRVLEALKAEIQVRQETLKRLNLRDIARYHRFYSHSIDLIHSPGYQPLPHLFILVDEFAQLARDMPDFLRELVRTAQIGRSLGLHLILGTQSPMDVITDEMNANLQFRICLRVQNIEASRAMLRRPDAAYLPPNQPGRGFFQVGERGVFKQFQTAYVGGDYAPPAGDDDAPAEAVTLEIVREDGTSLNLLPDFKSSFPGSVLQRQPVTTARAIAESIARYAHQQGIAPMHPLLLPPLEERLTLAAPFAALTIGGWNGQTWGPAGLDESGAAIAPGSAPVGVLDDVYHRTQHPLWIHLNAGPPEHGRRDGHVLVVGAPGTGKTMFLRTLALSLALLHPPDALHLYFISFTGAGLNDPGRLPHAERVIQGTETERLRRLFGRLMHTLEQRQATPAPAAQPIIVLMIDQYEQFRETCRETHLADFDRLMTEGRSAGLYCVVTASSINALPDRIRSLAQQRIAFQAGSPGDYVLTVGRLATAPEEQLPPGRGYVYLTPPLLAQVSLPARSHSLRDETYALGELAATARELREGYRRLKQLPGTDPDTWQSPAPVLELPAQLPLETLLPAAGPPPPALRVPLGRNDDDARSLFVLDWDASGPDFLVTGPPGAGKTTLLHTAVLAAAAHFPPQDVRFVLVDFGRRSLRPLAPLRHVLHNVADPAALRQVLRLAHQELAALSDEAPAAPGSVPLRFPALVMVIDDYDTFAEALSGEPDLLRHLRDLLRQYGDSGFYLWVAGYLERTTDPLMKQLLLRRAGFALMTRESLQKLYVRVAGIPAEAMPPGRAYYARHNSIYVVQMARATAPAALVEQVNRRYAQQPPAAWWYAGTEAPAPPARSLPPGAAAYDLEIDTAGLLQDLLHPGPDRDRDHDHDAAGDADVPAP
ncbi:MAG: AAA family ATPase [Anaerolineae bacterium]|nr:AAA family ATPase [Anaerolineae bacterium]